jgi:cytochrome c-type biogenesis protein CcmH/NrfG
LTITLGCKSEGEADFEKGRTLITSNDPADWEKAVEACKRSMTTEVRARAQLVNAWIRIGSKKISQADSHTIEREEEMARLLEGGIARHQAMQEMEYELYTSAVSNLEMAVSALPNDKNSYYLLGLAYGQISRGKLDPAESDLLLQKSEASYRTALNIDPEYVPALYGYAIILILQKRFPEAEKACMDLIGLEPKETRGYFALARIYFETEQYLKSENMYRVILELLPRKSPKRDLVEQNLRKLELVPPRQR